MLISGIQLRTCAMPGESSRNRPALQSPQTNLVASRRYPRVPYENGTLVNQRFYNRFTASRGKSLAKSQKSYVNLDAYSRPAKAVGMSTFGDCFHQKLRCLRRMSTLTLLNSSNKQNSTYISCSLLTSFDNKPLRSSQSKSAISQLLYNY